MVSAGVFTHEVLIRGVAIMWHRQLQQNARNEVMMV